MSCFVSVFEELPLENGVQEITECYCNAARVNAVHGLGLGIPNTNVQLTSMLHQR